MSSNHLEEGLFRTLIQSGTRLHRQRFSSLLLTDMTGSRFFFFYNQCCNHAGSLGDKVAIGLNSKWRHFNSTLLVVVLAVLSL